MTNEVKTFIEENVELIEENKWEKVYEKAATDLGFSTGEFTEAMLAADIHPEEHLKELPELFLSGSRNTSKFVIPDSITSIGSSAFEGCDSLTSVTFGEGSQLTSIGASAFKGCSSLTSITIPDSVTSIGSQAFYQCSSLASITIKNPGITFANDVFYGCNNLNIKFAGTREQWKNIAKGKFSGVKYTCNCVDGIIKKSR